ncbi:phage tail spike protein [Gracilibacillus marinus]|uniref:Phage tail spike protein n=1 Tax=Gracilibacillus marinus TaxID=630535 RepID=A0ABV8VV52_9BACI
MIHIADHQTDIILDDITEDEFWQDNHFKSLVNMQETFNFVTFADKSFSEFLSRRNRIIIPDEDGQLIEFVITNTRKYRANGALKCDVYTSAHYVTLQTAKVIQPHVTGADSAETHAINALAGTEYEVGTVAFKGVRTFTFEEHTNPYKYLKKIASEFDLELHFRLESDGTKIIKRYADLVERVGTWQGREVELGKDLEGIERKEDFSNIVTALVGLGPIREDGTRLEVVVENEEALQRWGRNGQHIIAPYEPQSTDLDMTEARLIELTENELEKRINSTVQYKADIIDLEKVIGLDHEKIRFADIIKIKDTKFNPPLYLEARIHTQDRSIKRKGKKTVELGDYIEYTEEQVNAIWKTLQQQIANKISMTELTEATYTKTEIDSKDNVVQSNAATDASNKANQAETNAKQHADSVANDAETAAKQHANQLKAQVDAELLNKAGLEYVNGQLALKADSALVNSINNTVSDLETTTSNLQQAVIDNADALSAQGGRITTVETDLNTVEGQLSVAITDLSNLEGTVSSQGTQINANTSAINLKANQSELDTVSGNVSTLSGELNVLAGQVELKASQSALENLEDDVTSVSNQVSSLQVSVNGITADVSSLESTVNGHTTDISSLNGQLTVQAGQIASKVDATYVTGAISDIAIGGRNYFVIKDALEDTLLAWASGNPSPSTGALTSGFMPVELNATYYVSPVRTDQLFYYDINKVHISDYSNMTGGTTIQIPNDERIAFMRIVFRNNFLDGRTKEEVEVKVEKGNKATDWTPAPEDVQSEIDFVFNYAESEINQLAGQISLKADSSTVNSINTRLSSAEIDINGLEGAITSKVEQTTFNALEGRVDTAESTITQHSNQINLKVDKNGVISSINQTAEAIKIQASKINLVGAVTVLSDITGNLGTINAGVINGATINGSIFNQNGTNGTITLGNNGLIFEGINSSIEMNVETTSGFHGDIASLVFRDGNGTRAMEIFQYYTDATIRTNRGLVLESGDLGISLDATAISGSIYGVDIRGGLTVSGLSELEQPTRQPLPLYNGWKHIGNPFLTPSYWKDSMGVVRLHGTIDGGNASNGTLISILPVGYRPAGTEIYTTTSNNAYCRVDVLANGEVRVQRGGSSAFIALSNISFKAEN